jgi:hypothetical protein
VALLGAAVAATSSSVPAATDIFRSDDPLAREPETQDASKVQEWEIDLFIDLAVNLFGRPGDDEVGVRAGNVNSIDEVPDSSWFTNRILARPVSNEEAARGPLSGTGPAEGVWTIVAAKQAGVAPGFTIVDSAGVTWFVSFDAHGYPDAATGAILVANKIFWTLGYFQAENFLTRVRPEQLVIGETATVLPMSGKTRRMRATDLEAIWERAHRSKDGSFRAVAARKLAGRTLGGFRYYGTRPDDPNDVVPHEHRRELRALKVFGAWTNLVDMKAGNTLDVLVTENGRALVRHYLQDVGSTFGTGALAPREYDEGWEHLYEGDLVRKRLLSLGFFVQPWQTAQYAEVPAIGRFEGVAFDPTTWKPRVPTAAFRHAQPDDLFWAARRVMAFSDDMLRAIARTAEYTDPAAERHLADVLIQRRNKIGAAYLNGVNPLVDFALSPDGRLSFHSAAAGAPHASSSSRYQIGWARFDNETGETTSIGEPAVVASEQAQAPVALPNEPGAFVRVSATVLDATPARPPVNAYFRRTPAEWKLVGLDRPGVGRPLETVTPFAAAAPRTQRR